MQYIQATIGEHVVQFDCESEVFASWIQKSFNTFHMDRSINRIPDFHIHIEDGFGAPFSNYDVEVSKGAEKVAYRRTDYWIEAYLDYRYAKVCAHDALALKHALMNLYSSFLVHHQWGLLIHSSSVVDKGKAHLFAGHSGSGKSTAAAYSLPRELLSDEASIVKIMPHEAIVFPSPFSSGLEVANNSNCRKLTSIQLLKQAPETELKNLSKSCGLLQLIDKVFYWKHDSSDMRKILQLLSMLANAVPIYELYFEKNDRFWELIS